MFTAFIIVVILNGFVDICNNFANQKPLLLYFVSRFAFVFTAFHLMHYRLDLAVYSRIETNKRLDGLALSCTIFIEIYITQTNERKVKCGNKQNNS
jgi:hypothetical protein